MLMVVTTGVGSVEILSSECVVRFSSRQAAEIGYHE